MDFLLTPDPLAHPELGVLIAALEDGTREWLENLGEVSPEAVVWQPYPDGPSIGGILLHMIDCESYWLRVVAAGEVEDVSTPEAIYGFALNVDDHYWPAPPPEPLKWYLELHRKRREEHLAYIRHHADPNTMHGKSNDQTYRWIVAHLVQHDSYHGGQTVLLNEMYKRTTGAPLVGGVGEQDLFKD